MKSIKDRTKIGNKLKTIKGIQAFVVDQIEYMSDMVKGHNDYWQFPIETWFGKVGDCEDHAILMIALIYEKLGKKSKLVIVKTKTSYHAIVEFEGKWYDSTSKLEINQNHKTWKHKRGIPFWWLDWEIRIRRVISKIKPR